VIVGHERTGLELEPQPQIGAARGAPDDLKLIAYRRHQREPETKTTARLVGTDPAAVIGDEHAQLAARYRGGDVNSPRPVRVGVAAKRVSARRPAQIDSATAGYVCSRSCGLVRSMLQRVPRPAGVLNR
jgi:hypothetical protein